MVTYQIDQRFGRIGLNIRNANYDLQSRPAQLNVRQEPAQINMEQPAAILEIDYTPVREVLGYRSIASQMRHFNQEAQATYYEGLRRRIKEGHQMGEIEKGMTIGQIAAQATAPERKEIGIVYLPMANIDIIRQPVEWQAQEEGVKTDFNRGSFDVKMKEYKDISVYWEQKPYIDIDVTGWAVDIKR